MDTLATPRHPSPHEELPSTTPTTDFAVIEAQKENIRPHVSGRSAATLSNVFGKSSETDRLIQEGHEAHQKAIEEAEKRDREGEEMQDGIADVLDAYNRSATLPSAGSANTEQIHPFYGSASPIICFSSSPTARIYHETVCQ